MMNDVMIESTEFYFSTKVPCVGLAFANVLCGEMLTGHEAR